MELDLDLALDLASGFDLDLDFDLDFGLLSLSFGCWTMGLFSLNFWFLTLEF